MYRLPNQILFGLLSLVPLVGCAFSPGTPGEETGTGGASSTGSGVGSGGVSGITTGQGLTGGDIGITGSAGTMSCGQATVPIMPLPPDILIVQDRSGSMDDDQNDATCNGGCGAKSKWALVTAAINQVVSGTDTTVNWGLKFFADANAQCGVNAGVAVGVGPGSGPAVATAITGSTTATGGVVNGSYTPTRAAVDAASAYLSTLTDPNSKYILLATDGLPNCPEGCTGNSCTNTPNAAETANVEASITAAQAANFKTFVVGIATSSDAAANTALNGFAMAGGEPQAGAATQYYSVTDTASLVTALNKIVGIIASCTISLSSAPTGFTNVVISATDASGKPVAIPMDPTNGWSYDANKANVILNGTACADLQNGTYSDFNFNYACKGVVICIDKNPDGTCAS
ncbi:MAG TPA: vWA domain-containing protein [Polyangia bacterium]|nr:vWA domain-containing protein [Polyangia bacterium]